MNPYDFVRIDWSKAPERRPAALLDRLGGVTGTLSGSITALTPIFIPAHRGRSPEPFLRDGRGRAVIPGSSLKGLFRSLVETIAPGCWWLYDGRYRNRDGEFENYDDRLPEAFRACSRLNQLCVACRLYGMIAKGARGATRDHLLGKVGFDDAVCVEERRHDHVYTPILDAPKPRHRVWYFPDGRVAGRKYYFHQPFIHFEREFRVGRQGGQPFNRYITPLDAGSRFEFRASFHNVEGSAEWQALLYTIVLEEGVRHKIGYAKPAGLGSVQVVLNEIKLIDPSARYRSEAGATVYAGESLQTYLRAQIDAFTGNKSSITLQDLRRIWAWPPADGVAYKYPARDWFDHNPRAEIHET